MFFKNISDVHGSAWQASSISRPTLRSKHRCLVRVFFIFFIFHSKIFLHFTKIYIFFLLFVFVCKLFNFLFYFLLFMFHSKMLLHFRKKVFLFYLLCLVVKYVHHFHKQFVNNMFDICFKLFSTFSQNVCLQPTMLCFALQTIFIFFPNFFQPFSAINFQLLLPNIFYNWRFLQT